MTSLHLEDAVVVELFLSSITDEHEIVRRESLPIRKTKHPIFELISYTVDLASWIFLFE